MMKREIFQEGLTVLERLKIRKKGELVQVGQRHSQKDSKKARKCFKCDKVGYFKRECPLWKKCKKKKDGFHWFNH